jgi:hypothetical protein
VSESASSLRALIESHRPHINPGGYPVEVRERVSAYVGPHREKGMPWSVLSDALGVSGTTLANWLKPSGVTPPRFLPIPISSTPIDQIELGGHFTLEAPNGWRVEGLTLHDIAALMGVAS